MRRCPYCGRVYPDNLLFCPDDRRALTDDRVHWGGAADAKPARNARWIKAGAAGLAFVPILVFLAVTWLQHAGVLTEATARPVLVGCIICEFPAFSILALMQSFNTEWPVLATWALVLMLMWSSFLAWFFQRLARMFLGEEEPPASQGKYDWSGFQVRFAVGFVLGFFFGWRFVRHTTSLLTLFIACVLTGFVGGCLYGISRPPDLWRRG